MKISYNWLKEYINCDVQPEELSEILTDTGLEIEGMEKVQSVPGGLEGVVIGYVKSCEKHPNADKLQLTTVDVGEHDLLPIVCGAPNVAEGQTVVVATVGCTLYPDQGPFEIKKSKIRGAVSEGMLCAEDELGLGHSHDGIIVIDEDLKPGTPAAEYFGVETDYVLEIGLTPNRTDAMGHYGVARDLYAYLLRHNRRASLTLPSVDAFEAAKGKDFELNVENTEACPRYMGLRLSNIQVADSPTWLQNRLKAIGLTPKNNVVDITNYVMHEYGQPLHAFDFDKINNQEIRVKNLKQGTKFTTLDEVERELHADDLMICDGNDNPMCIAGVFGGVNSGVSESTKEVFLESANFNAVSVRKTAKRHALNTDASFRYERGIDEAATVYAMKRAAMLMQEICSAKISSELVDVYPSAKAPTTVSFSPSRMNQMIGQDIEEPLLRTILKGLEIEILREEDQRWILGIPAYRVDVTREADVLEEVLRIYGYNEVKLSGRIHAAIEKRPAFDLEQAQESVSALLASNGYHEAMSNSLTKLANYQGWEGYNEENFVKMLNPLSSDLAVMRRSLLFNGLESIAYNQNRKRENIKMFEFGKVYHRFNERKVEEKKLAIFLSGETYGESWMNLAADQHPFYFLKEMVNLVLAQMQLSDVQQKVIKLDFAAQALQLHLGKQVLAEISILGAKVLKQFDIKVPVCYAEINWELLCNLSAKKSLKLKPISKYPSVRRDLALLIAKDLPFEQLRSTAFKTEKKMLKEVQLFDVYEGKNLPEGKKSYALSFILEDENKTLSDKQIDKVMRKLQSAFEREHQAELRS